MIRLLISLIGHDSSTAHLDNSMRVTKFDYAPMLDARAWSFVGDTGGSPLTLAAAGLADLKAVFIKNTSTEDPLTADTPFGTVTVPPGGIAAVASEGDGETGNVEIPDGSPCEVVLVGTPA